MSMKNYDTSGDRTRDLPACSAVPQPTASPRAPYFRSSTREIKFRISLATAAFNNKKARVTNKVDLSLRKILVMFYIWRVALYDAES
jgi:hypothetical protein